MLQYLHSNSIVHGDLKTGNVLLMTDPASTTPAAAAATTQQMLGPQWEGAPVIAGAMTQDCGTAGTAGTAAAEDITLDVVHNGKGTGALGPGPGPGDLVPADNQQPVRLVAKVSDFGLSRMLTGPEHTHTTASGEHGFSCLPHEVLGSGLGWADGSMCGAML